MANPKQVKRKSEHTPEAAAQEGLRRLREAEASRVAATQHVHDIVAALRSPDTDGECLVSWQEVGEALGITKQAAMQRYWRRGL